MLNPGQEPPASTEATNKDLKNMEVLCTFIIRIESKIWNISVSKTSDHIQIKIKMPNPCQEPPVSTKAPNDNLKDMGVPCTFKIKIETQNFHQAYIRNQWPY